MECVLQGRKLRKNVLQVRSTEQLVSTITAKSVWTIPIPPSPESMLKYQLHTVRNGYKLTPTLIQGEGGIRASLNVNVTFGQKNSSWIQIQPPSSQLLLAIAVSHSSYVRETVKNDLTDLCKVDTKGNKKKKTGFKMS